MAVFSRKIKRLVAVRGSGTPNAKQLRPCRITAVGTGTNVTCKALDPDGEVYADIPRWSRSAPTTTGWVRT